MEDARETRLRRIRHTAKWLLIVYWLVLFAATHTPKVTSVTGSDKTDHIAAYAGLAVLTQLWWFPPTPRQQFILVVGLAVYGAVDELLQIPVGRHCDIWDWVADVIGVILAVACFAWLRSPGASRSED